MFIGFPTCNWKCEKECGMRGICQNSSLATSPTLDIPIENIVKRYLENPISQAIVLGGLEPMDSWENVVRFISEIRKHTQDDVVIYTGYYEGEISDNVEYLRQNYDNIIIKFGRFIPNHNRHYDKILGVYLASDNQYGEKIS
jgi:hypothetical protein